MTRFCILLGGNKLLNPNYLKFFINTDLMSELNKILIYFNHKLKKQSYYFNCFSGLQKNLIIFYEKLKTK